MKTILVDAVDALVIEGVGIFKEMYDLLETYPNKKIVLTGANDEQFKAFGLDKCRTGYLRSSTIQKKLTLLTTRRCLNTSV